MNDPTPPLPTESELRILEILWDHGPSTAREVHEIANRAHPTVPTTVLKHLQIMAEKGTVLVDKSRRPQTYRPARPRQQTQRHLVGDLLERAFRGESGPLVLQALAARRATPEERQAIRDMLDRMEKEDGK